MKVKRMTLFATREKGFPSFFNLSLTFSLPKISLFQVGGIDYVPCNQALWGNERKARGKCNPLPTGRPSQP